MKYIVIACIFLICGEVYAMYPYYTGDSYVYMDGDKQTINDTFSFAAPFRNGLAIVKKEDGKAGVINTSGKFIIKPKFDKITRLSDDIICFKAANYYTKEKSSFTVFGISRWLEKHVKYKLYDAGGRSFYGYSGRDEYDPPIHIIKDKIFVQGKDTEVFADNGKGRIKRSAAVYSDIKCSFTEGKTYELPQHSRMTFISPDTIILTNTILPEDDATPTRWEFCIYNAVDGEFVLPWQDSTLRALGKNRERFVTEKDGVAILINRQGSKISSEYTSITTTADPQLYLADRVYIFAVDGRELRIAP